MDRHATSDAMAACIAACLECHRDCTATLAECLRHGGEHAAPEHVRLMTDCAAICITAAGFMLRGSPHHPHFCRECAEICRECAAECDRMAADMPAMAACADTCRRCAVSCAAMA